MKVIICGAGGQGRVVLDILRADYIGVAPGTHPTRDERVPGPRIEGEGDG